MTRSALLNAGAFHSQKWFGHTGIQAPGHRAAIWPCLRRTPTKERQHFRCIDLPAVSLVSMIKQCLVASWSHGPFRLESSQTRNFRYDRNVTLCRDESRSDSTIEGRG